MVDPIKEFLQINVHHIPLTTVHDLLCRLDRIMWTPVWPEPIAMMGEVGLKNRFQYPYLSDSGSMWLNFLSFIVIVSSLYLSYFLPRKLFGAMIGACDWDDNMDEFLIGCHLFIYMIWFLFFAGVDLSKLI